MEKVNEHCVGKKIVNITLGLLYQEFINPTSFSVKESRQHHVTDISCFSASTAPIPLKMAPLSVEDFPLPVSV